jgi:hypothetical protein
MVGLDDDIAALPPGTHACVAYREPDERTRTVASFLRHGVRHGERCIYAAEAPARDAVAAQLHADGVCVDRLREQGALVLVDLTAVYLPRDQFSAERQAQTLAHLIDQAHADGFAGFRGVGEARYPIEDAVAPAALLAYEAAASDVLRTRRGTGLCVYDRQRTGAALLADLVRTHPVALVGDRACDNPFCGDHAAGGQLGVDGLLDAVLQTHLRARDTRAMNRALIREATSLSADNQRLRERAADLEQALGMRDGLLGMIARQLREPLPGLETRLRALLHDERLAVAHDELELCREEVERLAELAAHVRAIAGAGTARVTLEPEPGDLSRLVTAAAAVHVGPEVHVSTAGAVDGSWDRAHVHEVVRRLLTVAAVHSWGTPLDLRVEAMGPRARIALAYRALDADPLVGGGDPAGQAVPRAAQDRLTIELWTTRELVARLGGTLGVSGWADARVTITVELPRGLGTSGDA